ncbi:MAG: ASPIC/UnbV domain-containing protein [Verrucomicrobia bacterium]|nr:ASPIC/UnbV domain-containing protein [Verrucomicrobiota bacterium]
MASSVDGESAMPLYFGLGDIDKLDSIEVVWPSKTKQVVKSPRIDAALRINEPPQ